MSTGTQSVPQRILVATSDAALRESRSAVIAALGYSVVAPSDVEEIEGLIKREGFAVLVLGHSLESEMALRLAAHFRRHQPHGRIIEILKMSGSLPTTQSDATLVGLDGPVALQRCVQEQLRATIRK
jgi:DNA-binding NtrC family response regulator